MLKKIIAISLLFSSSAFAYEDKSLQIIENSNKTEVLVDVVSYASANVNRHFEFAKKLSERYPNKHFKFMFHGNATYNAVQNDKLNNYPKTYSDNDFTIIKDLKNIDFYVCKMGLRKKNIDSLDVNDNFNKEHTSGRMLGQSIKNNELVIVERDIRKRDDR